MAIVLFGVALPRIALILRGRAPIDGFPTHERHGGERYRRTLRAHANAIENLPLLAAVVLIAAEIGLSDPTFDLLACAVVPARVVQTVAHISSGSRPAIAVRGAGYAVQMACIAGMVFSIVAFATR